MLNNKRFRVFFATFTAVFVAAVVSAIGSVNAQEAEMALASVTVPAVIKEDGGNEELMQKYGPSWMEYMDDPTDSARPAPAPVVYKAYGPREGTTLYQYDLSLRSVESADELRYHDLSDRLTVGEWVAVSSLNEANALATYYTCSYAFTSPNNCPMSLRQTGSGYELHVDSTPVSQEERNACLEYVLACFGSYEGKYGADLMRAVCTDVHKKIGYNKARTCSNLVSAVDSGSGVCTHYAACVSILATMNGVPTKMVGGKRRAEFSSNHEWNEAFYDGIAVQWDACMFKDGAMGSTTYALMRVNKFF